MASMGIDIKLCFGPIHCAIVWLGLCQEGYLAVHKFVTIENYENHNSNNA